MDLDIDAVNLQTFDFDNSGRFVGHSPYYSLQNKQFMKASEQLPFPTGKELQIYQTDNIEETTLFKLINYIGVDNELFNIQLGKKGITIELNLNTPEHFYQLSEILKYKDFVVITSENIPFLRNKINEQLSKRYNFDASRTNLFENLNIAELEHKLVDIINNHNLYLDNIGSQTKEKLIKNYLVQQLYDIIVDPINQIQAQSSVDEVTEPAKALGNSPNNPKSALQNTTTPGNVANKPLQINENMVGKDGIAICATALKSFFALTSLNQIIFEEGDVSEIEKLLFNVKIGGKSYHSLANNFVKDLNSVRQALTEGVSQGRINTNLANIAYDTLFTLLYTSDAALSKSGLLSLATDNAKELVLAKINAGTATIGLYLYGMAIGMDIDLLYDIIASPLGFRIAELTKGNLFEGDDGLVTVKRVLDYLNSDPENQLNIIDRQVDLKDIDIESPSYFILKQLKADPAFEKYKGDRNFLNSSIKGLMGNKGAFISLLHKVRNEKLDLLLNNQALANNPMLKYKYKTAVNQIIDFLLQYSRDVELAHSKLTYDNIYGGGIIYDDFEDLVMGAEEYKKIGKILRLNQEIKTNPTDLLTQIGSIENCIIDRMDLLIAYYRRHGEGAKAKKLNKEKSKWKIDLVKFMSDGSYRRKYIEKYDSIKQSFNPLRILDKVPLYKGYAEALTIADEALLAKSIKYRLMRTKVPNFCETYKIRGTKMTQQVIRNAQNAFDSYVINDWLLHYHDNGKGFVFTIPASTDKQEVLTFGSNLETPIINKYDKTLALGTTMGNANFKLYMEKVLIPLLKEKYSDNLFIKDLTTIVNDKTILGIPSVSYGLQINMLPMEEWEQNRFDEYKKAFNNLNVCLLVTDATGKRNFTVKELFYIYNLICSNGKIAPKTLTKIFEDYSIQENSAGWRRNKWSAKFETLNNTTNQHVNNLALQILPDLALAPSASLYSTETAIMKSKDPNTGNIGLYKKASLNTVDDYDNDFDYSMMDEDDIYDGYGPRLPEGIKLISTSGNAIQLPNSANQDFFYNPLLILQESQNIQIGNFNISLFNGHIKDITQIQNDNTLTIDQRIELSRKLKDHLVAQIDPKNPYGEKLVDLQFLNDLIDVTINEITNRC